MKKIMMLFIITCMLTGCAEQKENLESNNPLNGNVTNEVNSEVNNGINEDENEYYKIVNFTELKKLLEDDKAKLIYFGSDGCGACLNFKPIAKKYAKENKINIYFVLLDNLTDDEYIALDSIISFQYIPYITVYKNKEFIYQESGVHTNEDLDNLVKEHKIGE